MKMLPRSIIIALSISVLPGQAAAFNFGIVRAPDWMDPYFVFLLLAMVPMYIAVKLTKPRNVPFNQLYRTQMDPLPKVYFRLLQITAFIFFILLFLGMGLRRLAEANAV